MQHKRAAKGGLAVATRHSVHLRLMGLPVLHCGDGSTCTLQRKDAALLARLALDGPCSRATLAA